MLGKYIYGIIKNKDRCHPEPCPELVSGSVSGSGLSTVDHRDLSAVISDAEYKDYHALPKEEVIKDLTSHQQMIEKIMEQFTVLPVKFGTILKDEEGVRSVLEKGYSFLRDTLRKMEDKIELDLVCFWNEQKAAQMAFQESKKIRDYYTSGGMEMERKIALGKLVAQYLSEKREKLSSQILGVLKKEGVGSCAHTLADVNMLLNQAFLLERENEERFNHTLNKLDGQFADLVNFRLVGPLPPYSFATVVIDTLDKEEVERARKLLNLKGQINKDNVKKVYDKLAFELHPDKGGDPLEFERATKSYKLLRKFAEQGVVGVYLYRWEER